MVVDKTYDVCFGVGEACMCSQSLRAAGLQFASYPFDWIGKESHNSLECAQLIASDFKDFLNREDFVYNGLNPANGLGMYKNLKTGFNHPHDFANRPVIDDEMYRDLADKEDLRGRMKHLKEKFLRQISSDGKTLFVRRLSETDWTSPTLEKDLLELDKSLVELGARNYEYLLIVERVNQNRIPRLPHFHVRTVQHFNPVCDVANAKIGDFIGWNVIFSEFRPKVMPKRKDDYKFNHHR